jgi:hypothetical protein
MENFSMVLKGTIIVVLFTALLFAQAPTVEQVEKMFGRPAFLIKTTSPPPTIDGDLSDAAWQSATAHSLDHFDACSSPLEAPTTVKMLCDQDNLYVGARCDEPRMDLVQVDNFQGDNVRLLVDPHHKHPAILGGADNLKFSLNPDGVKLGTFGSASVVKGSDHWTCEFSIPLVNLGIASPNTPTVIGLNFVRIRPQVGLINPCNCMAR